MGLSGDLNQNRNTEQKWDRALVIDYTGTRKQFVNSLTINKTEIILYLEDFDGLRPLIFKAKMKNSSC